MELPRALQPWQQALSIFPKDLAIALGGVIDKLALLVGPLISPDGAGRNNPDGLDGIGRRGSFERLLTTEWALAEEAPLEFLRRVSTGELSFLQIAHQKPSIARKCIALFDVGPDQRGGPRIVHLALLILLAQRAIAGKAAFSWGILQESPKQLMADVNKESVRLLVNGGSQKLPTILDVIDFHQLFQEEAEIWFIGGAELSALLPELTPYRVLIEDSFDPDAPNELEVSITHESKKPKSARIALPPGNTAVRLLRDPFEVARAQTQKSRVCIAPDTNIVLSRDSRKIFLRGAEGELVTVPIPNSPNCKESPKPRIFRPPPVETLAAVGRLMGTRSIAAVTYSGENVIIHELSPRGCTSVRQKQYRWRAIGEIDDTIHDPPWRRENESTTRLGRLIQLQTNGEFIVYDGEQLLFQTQQEWFYQWRYSVRDVLHDSTSLSWLSTSPEPVWTTCTATLEKHTLHPHTFAIRSAPGGFLAARISPTTWQILNAKGQAEQTRELPLWDEVLGVADSKDFLFYVLDEQRMHINCIGADKTETCFTAPAPIKAIEVAPTCWLIAFITEDDELFVYSRDHKKLVLHMRLGEP
jgi:hypothetical protein